MDPIGKIQPSVKILITPAVDAAGKLIGVMILLNSILKIIFIVAGLYGFFNLILAGFEFMSASGDPKKITKAWNKIWQSIMGLLIIVSSFLIAAIIGILLFKDATAILKPTL